MSITNIKQVQVFSVVKSSVNRASKTKKKEERRATLEKKVKKIERYLKYVKIFPMPPGEQDTLKNELFIMKSKIIVLDKDVKKTGKAITEVDRRRVELEKKEKKIKKAMANKIFGSFPASLELKAMLARVKSDINELIKLERELKALIK